MRYNPLNTICYIPILQFNELFYSLNENRDYQSRNHNSNVLNTIYEELKTKKNSRKMRARRRKDGKEREEGREKDRGRERSPTEEVKKGNRNLWGHYKRK